MTVQVTFREPGMGHVVLRLPLGQGAGQQLQAVLCCLEALEDAATDHTHDAVPLAGSPRVEETLQAK